MDAMKRNVRMRTTYVCVFVRECVNMYLRVTLLACALEHT